MLKKIYKSRSNFISIKRFLVLAFLIFCSAYLGLVFYAFIFADKRIFPPLASSYSTEAQLVHLPLPSGQYTLARYWASSANSFNGYTLVYNHGNGQDLGTVALQSERFARYGFNVIAYEYPGYGLAPGKPTEKGVYEAALAAYNYATETLKIPPSKLIFYGYSLGGGPATYIASQKPIAALILESTFTSTFRVVTQKKLLWWDFFDNLSLIDKVHCPILFIHGGQDTVVPAFHTYQLAKNATASSFVEILFVPEAVHFNCSNIDPDGYYNALNNLLMFLSPSTKIDNPFL